MRIVIVGDGKVGFILMKLLCQEGHDVVVIDNNLQVLHESQETLDVAVVNGNGATVQAQREAGVPESDLLIAATSRDEVNLLCCIVARRLGCPHIIARVRNPEYDQQIDFLKDDLGLSLAINPEKYAAREIWRLLQYPSFLKRDSFASGRVELVEIKLPPNNILVGRRLHEISHIWKVNGLICAVDRNSEITIPDGSFQLLSGDKITVAAAGNELAELIRTLGISTHKIDRVMIVGGSRLAAYLAFLLIRAKVHVTIIEKDRARCRELCDLLPKAVIINGNGTQQDLLLGEGIRETGAVITLTGMDEENLIVSMFANYVGVPKTITKINRTEYTSVFSNMGIDTIVSPKHLIADEIVRYVRAINDSGPDSVSTLYHIMDGKAEGLGFQVPTEGFYQGISLSELQLKPNILIAGIIRSNQVIIPKGQDFMQAGDSVVVVTTSSRPISHLTDIFAPEYLQSFRPQEGDSRS